MRHFVMSVFTRITSLYSWTVC